MLEIVKNFTEVNEIKKAVLDDKNIKAMDRVKLFKALIKANNVKEAIAILKENGYNF